MNQVVYFTILRLLHISCGVFWAGASIYLSFYIIPAVNAAGREGTVFMQQLAKTNRLPFVMTITAIITVLSGCILIWKLSGGLQTEWLQTRHGMVLTGGGIAAIIAFFAGFFINRPAVDRINKIGAVIAKAGGPPSAEQLQELSAIRKRLTAATRFIALLLIVTVIAMSIVRYL